MTIILNKFALNPSIYSEALWNKTPTVKEILNVLQHIGNRPKNFQPTFLAQSNEIIRRSPSRPIFTIDEYPEQFVNNLNANNDKLTAKRPESSRFSGLRRRELNIKTDFYKPLPLPKPFGLLPQSKPAVKGSLPAIVITPPQPEPINVEPARKPRRLWSAPVPLILPPQPEPINAEPARKPRRQWSAPVPLILPPQPEPINAEPARKPRRQWSAPVPLILPPQPDNIDADELPAPPLPLVELFGGLKPEDIIDDGTLSEDEFLWRADKLLETFQKMRELMKIAYS
ncbi:hypothetical protein SC206_13075 [Rouxiella sp. T17]|uniref:hypothetical protein n=1 Tax=Rouxiella sp. T17 TaxID=3085684 RepID=UPI002FCAAED4